jgi:hypothetical protein
VDGGAVILVTVDVVMMGLLVRGARAVSLCFRCGLPIFTTVDTGGHKQLTEESSPYPCRHPRECAVRL